MVKETKHRKEQQKRPALSLKEKRARKREKKSKAVDFGPVIE